MALGGKIIWAFALALGIGQAKSATSLTVLIYDYAQVPHSELANAEAFAARSYRAAGIELTWVECASSEDGGEKFRACEQASNGHPLFLKIIPEEMAAGIRQSAEADDAPGIAFVSHAFVLYPRVREMASVWGLPEYVVLGRTMAHELGHLLHGASSHSAAGLMRPRFGQRDLSLESGQFLFDPQQAKRLLASLHSRQTPASIPAFPNASGNEAHRLTILMMDYVGIPASTRSELETNTKRILGSAGIAVEFVECYGGAVETVSGKCIGPFPRIDLVLRVFQPKFATKGEQLGYTAMTSDGGAYITVFINPAQHKARLGVLSNGTLLGHAVAHEIGHVLLGANSHSPTGIMRPVWFLVDEEQMAQGVLLFDVGQAARMQAAIARLRQ